MFDSMNRRLYWTLVNFFKILGLVVSVLATAIAIVLAVTYSTNFFGTPIPVAVFFIVCFLLFMSFKISKFDVEIEKRNQEETLKSLKKDWTDV